MSSPFDEHLNVLKRTREVTAAFSNAPDAVEFCRKVVAFHNIKVDGKLDYSFTPNVKEAVEKFKWRPEHERKDDRESDYALKVLEQAGYHVVPVVKLETTFAPHITKTGTASSVLSSTGTTSSDPYWASPSQSKMESISWRSVIPDHAFKDVIDAERTQELRRAIHALTQEMMDNPQKYFHIRDEFDNYTMNRYITITLKYEKPSGNNS